MTVTADLIALASSYYPSMGDPGQHTLEEWRRKFASSAETRALRRKQQQAVQNHPAWRAFLVELDRTLPDHRIRDESRMELDASYAALISVPGDEPYNRILAIYASFVAPVYLLYELQEVVLPNGQFESPSRLDEPSPQARPAAAHIERELSRRFGVERIDPEVSRAIVPHIAMSNLGPGEVTLADALFCEQRR